MSRLKDLRESLGLKQKDFAAELGLAQTTYSGYESGAREPHTDFWVQVSTQYGVTIDWLLGAADDPHKSRFETPSRLERRFAELDEHGKRLVETVMDLEAERLSDGIEQMPTTKIIPLFTTAAAAGPGEPQSQLDAAFEDYEVPIGSSAEFAVRISGDSMEPELHDGEIALCLKRKPEIAEIVVAMVDGFVYVKQFITDGRNIYLRSINRRRKDADVDIWYTGNQRVTCLGTVIHRKIPLVSQW